MHQEHSISHQVHGIAFACKHRPPLDPGFIPFEAFSRAFLKSAREPLAIALHRTDGAVSVHRTFIHGDHKHTRADCYHVERLLKTLLWSRGAYRVEVCGSRKIWEHLHGLYAMGGAREFDVKIMERIYERTFEVVHCSYHDTPREAEVSTPIGKHLEGCRIGFDAGGSDRKVSAVINGEAVFSQETVWHPKTAADPRYHYEGVLESFRAAAAHLPRVDAIGVSSAGTHINNRTVSASLFLAVPEDQFDDAVKETFIRAAREIGDVPLVVANDGDVSALAGAMFYKADAVLGIAMGTSQAAGFIDSQGHLTGWLSELAFAPVDASPHAMADEWSGDIGCGVKYFSQDAVIKLAQTAGIDLGEQLTPAEKLKKVQELLEAGSTKAEEVFLSIGCYLGYALANYHRFYHMEHVLLLGRVMSGRGGDLIAREARLVLKDEYPEVANRITLHLPDEMSRRVGQSVAAASLPAIQ